MHDPMAVITSDLHFSVSTLDIASQALRQAQAKALELEVPLIIAGDLNDTKAIIRGEVVNRLIDILSDPSVTTYIIVGNHDLLNEKGTEHSLNFLAPYCNVVQSPVFVNQVNSWLIPYFSDVDRLRYALKGIEAGSRIIMHQGIVGSNMGHYIQDKSALNKEDVADFRVISGHYHMAQDIKCGRPRKGAVGLFSYIGTPYTTTFAEANDGPKGYRILYKDGTLESVPTNLRKHVVLDIIVESLATASWEDLVDNSPKDLYWIKITGPTSELDKIKKQELGQKLFGHSNFKLDKIPTNAPKNTQETKDLKDHEILDGIIQNTTESAEQKEALKKLWREVLNEVT